MQPIDQRDREILQHLHDEGVADIQELCELLGVTRNAIRQRISRLETAGFLKSELQSQTRGRPRNVYSVTPEGLHALGENYRQLAVVLWETIVGFENPEIRQQLIQRVQASLVNRFRRQSGSESFDQRVDHLASDMKANGFNVQSQHSGELHILRETSCPFPILAEMDDTICQLERGVLEQVLGAPVEFHGRCRDGQSCCEFHVSSPVQGIPAEGW